VILFPGRQAVAASVDEARYRRSATGAPDEP